MDSQTLHSFVFSNAATTFDTTFKTICNADNSVTMDTIYDLEITSYYIQLFHPSKQASIFSEAIKKIWPVGYLRNAFYASCGKAIFPRHNLKHKTFPFVFSDALYLRKWLFCLPFKCFRFHASSISRHLHFLFPSIWI